MNLPAPNKLHALIEQTCQLVGLDRVGVATVKQPKNSSAYLAWLEQNMHGNMHYMKTREKQRLDPTTLLPGAKSLICFSWNYFRQDVPPDSASGIARYAQGDDYHLKFKQKLREFWQRLGEHIDLNSARARFFVDSAPIMERDFAAAAGLGWIGKNTCLIDTELGSWLFLGEILTDLDLEPTAPKTDHCGTCTACIDACPTDALAKPYVLDARRCISYLTIEKKDSFSKEEENWLGEHVFGCDICQDVCPWNRKSPEGTFFATGFRADLATAQANTYDIQDQNEFEQTFEKTPVLRAGLNGWQRNVDAVKKNQAR